MGAITRLCSSNVKLDTATTTNYFVSSPCCPKAALSVKPDSRMDLRITFVVLLMLVAESAAQKKGGAKKRITALETRLDTEVFFTVSPNEFHVMEPGEIMKFGGVVTTSDTIITNQLASTGVFACKHSGLYFFSLTVMNSGNSASGENTRLGIYLNENLLTLAAGHFKYEQGATSSYVKLEAGDQVSVRCLDIGGYKCYANDPLTYTSFAGS